MGHLMFSHTLANSPQVVVDLAKKETRSSYADFADDDEAETVTEDLAGQLNENLTRLAIPQLSSLEQIHLANTIECVATAEKHRRSMDDNAMRYLLFFRQYMLCRGQARKLRVNVTWREIVWAYHSDSQDILIGLVSRQFQDKMLWSNARESGMFMWMSDLTALVSTELLERKSSTKIGCRERNSGSLLAMSTQRLMRRTPSTAAFST